MKPVIVNRDFIVNASAVSSISLYRKDEKQTPEWRVSIFFIGEEEAVHCEDFVNETDARNRLLELQEQLTAAAIRCST